MKTAILAILILCAGLHARAEAKPNLVVFMVDDMGWQDTSLPFWRTNGIPVRTFLNARYRTPNMERLARRGMVFTKAYGQPVCSPSRCSLLTGMNAARHRVTNWTLNRDTATDAPHPTWRPPEWAVNSVQPEGTRAKGTTRLPVTGEERDYAMEMPYTPATTLPQLLTECGYHAIHCGKAHWGTRGTPGANPLNMGFAVNIAGSEIGGPADYRGRTGYGKGAFHVPGLDENAEYREEDVFLTEALTREALAALDARPAEKPFFLYLSHYAVHVPIDERGYDARFADGYRDPRDGHPWSDNERRYAGLVEGMDKSLGDVLDYLDAHGLADNTYVIFMSDNGGLALSGSGRMGDRETNWPLRAGKGSVYEGGVREPMIAAGPGIAAGAATDAQVIIEDFFPTLLELAGGAPRKPVQTVDGVSFAGVLRGKSAGGTERPLLFPSPHVWAEGAGAANYGPHNAMRLGRWKVVRDELTGRVELYDLETDIAEAHDLAAEHPDRAEELVRQMDALIAERGRDGAALYERTR